MGAERELLGRAKAPVELAENCGFRLSAAEGRGDLTAHAWLCADS